MGALTPVTPCDGGRAGPAGGSCRVAHSSGCCYFWQADYIMSRDGFANPALRVRTCVRSVTDDVAQHSANQALSLNLV